MTVGQWPAPGVEQRLELGIEVVDAEQAPAHRRQHLDVAVRVQTEPRRDAIGDQVFEGVEQGLRLGSLDEVEVGFGGALDPWQLSRQDPVGVDHDHALAGLAEDLAQADDRQPVRADQVGEDPARSDRGQLIDVADEDQASAAGHRLQELTGERDVQHRGLVDDHQIGLEGALAAAAEAAADGVVLQQAVDRLRRQSGGEGQAVCGPPGGRGQQQPLPLAAQDLDHRPDQGRLAGTGAAGDHQQLSTQRQPDGVDLRRRQLETPALLEPGDRPWHVRLRDGRLGLRQPPQVVGDPRLGLVQLRSQDRRGVLEWARYQPAGGGLGVDHPLDQLRRGVEQLDGAVDESLARQVDVPFVGPPAEDIEQPGGDPLGRVRGQPQAGGDRVGTLEADAKEIGRQSVGVLSHQRGGIVAPQLERLQALPGGQTVGAEEDHRLLHPRLTAPGLLDAAGAHRPDALDLGEPLGLLLDRPQGVEAEPVNQALCHHLADALDETRAQVLLHPAAGLRAQGQIGGGLELPAVLAVEGPAAGEPGRLAGLQARQPADHGQLGRAVGPREPQHRPAGLGVAIDDPLDDTFQSLPSLLQRLVLRE